MGMYNDDENDFDSLEDLLKAFAAIKNGINPGKFLEAEDYEVLFDHFIKHNRVKDAHFALETGIMYHPFSIELLMMKAELQYEGQNFGQALKTLDQIDEINNQYINAVILRSDVLLDMDKPDEAIRLLNERVATAPEWDKPALLLTLADIYDELANFEMVYQTLVAILTIDPNQNEALHKLSFWADLANKNEESIQFHHSILDKDPFNAVAWYNLASAHHSLKQYEEAVDAYEYCLALDDKLEAAYRNIADAYIRLRLFDKAIEALERNLEIGNPEDVIYEAMGQCFEKKKDYNKARYYYRQAIKLSPADDLFFFRIGETYLREKKFDKAYESYLAAFNLNDKNYMYAYAVGLCLLETESEKEAIVFFLKTIALKSNHKNAWIGMGKALYRLGLYEEIILQMDMAEEHCGQKAEFEFLNVAALFALGKSKEAVLVLHKAMDLASSKFKLLQELQPDILTRKSVADVWAAYKKK